MMLRRIVWLGLIIILLPLSAFASGKLIGTNKQVTDAKLAQADGEAFSPAVAVRGSTAYAAWVDTREDAFGTFDYAIYFARSTDSGATWSANRRLSTIAWDGYLQD